MARFGMILDSSETFASIPGVASVTVGYAGAEEEEEEQTGCAAAAVKNTSKKERKQSRTGLSAPATGTRKR